MSWIQEKEVSEEIDGLELSWNTRKRNFVVNSCINKQFIAVGCHYDVEDWLMPDWVFNKDTMTFHLNEGQKKNRPEIKFNIYKAKNKSIWRMFAKYHYLNHSHNNAAHTYIATINSNYMSILYDIYIVMPYSSYMLNI